MNCRDFQELIDSYLSDELLTETNHDVLRHLEDCADCRNVIKVRRKIRGHLKSAVINSPQYQIGKNFTHNLRTQLKHEALQDQEVNSMSQFGFRSWIAVAAGLILTFTLGFVLFSNLGNNETPVAAEDVYTTDQVPKAHLVNAAFGDHQFCAVRHDTTQPVRFSQTPAKYEKAEQVIIPQIKAVLTDYKLRESHTCSYRETEFTHSIFEKNDEILSVMLTDKDNAEELGKSIDFYSSGKYQMARFDVDETAVFVISGLNKQINSQVAQALYSPLHNFLTENNNSQTAEQLFYQKINR